MDQDITQRNDKKALLRKFGLYLRINVDFQAHANC